MIFLKCRTKSNFTDEKILTNKLIKNIILPEIQILISNNWIQILEGGITMRKLLKKFERKLDMLCTA